jgi:predicted transcriptional regulator
MQISDVKLELFRYIDNLEKSKLIQIYQHLIVNSANKPEADFWETLNDWQKNDIEAGLEDLEQGKKRNFDEVLSKYK